MKPKPKSPIELVVTISADAAAFNSGVALAQAAARSLSAELRKLATEAALDPRQDPLGRA